MTISSDTPVGKIATEFPLATRVFARHGIDFCCGGGKPIGSVCEAKALDTERVLEEINAEISASDDMPERWDEREPTELIDHILKTYHEPLTEELPRLQAMAQKVNDVHGHKQPDTLPAILATVIALKAELESHMAKEEQILFPMVRAGRGHEAGGPVSVMEQEHEAAGAALARLRELTNGYEVPAEACNTWRALWHGLAALEQAMHQHIHLENNILFPRALAGR